MEEKCAVLYKVQALPGRGDDLVKVWDEQFEQFAREPDTELYVLNRSVADADLFWCYELFANKGAFESHRGTPVVKRTLQAHLELVAQRESVVGVPVRATGLSL
jgi:quinol monooxygenase YgiN